MNAAVARKPFIRQSVQLFAACVLTTAVLLAIALPARALSVDVKQYTLQNGMKVIVVPDRRAPVVTQMVWYRVGSADEELGKSGIAHYLEHLLFKGTKTLKPGEFSRIIRVNGGEDNAFTSYDFTAYFERIAADRLELVMKLEADRMANSMFDDKDVKTELEVVKEERRSRTDNDPAALMSEQMNATAYIAHPYGRPIIGWMSEVEGLTAADAKAFYARHYTPANAALVVAGDVDPDKVYELAQKYYGVLKNTAEVQPRKRTLEPSFIAAKRVEMSDPRVASPSISRMYIVPGVNQAGPGVGEALDVLGTGLGQGSSSYLYRELVVRQKVASQVQTWYNGDTLDHGELSISINPAPGVDVAVAEQALDAALLKLKTDGIDPGLVERSRTQLLAATVYSLDSQFRLAYLFGSQFAIGRSVEDTLGWTDRIKQVTPEQVTNAAKAFLTANRSTTGILLPAPEKAAAAAN